MSRLQVGFTVLVLAVTCLTRAAQAQSEVCVGDANGDGEVVISELIRAVNNALDGCDLMPVTLRFRGVVGDQPFACGQVYSGIGISRSDILPADFRFYIHGIRLINDRGREVPLRLEQDGMWQQGETVLLDFENKARPCNEGSVATNSEVRGFAPAGTYTGLRFTLGVPFDLNHENAAVAGPPLNLTSMFWTWNAGYKFLRIDEALDRVRVHLGSTGCRNGPSGRVVACARPNRAEILLSGFDPTSEVILADLAALFAGSDLQSNAPDTAAGCESAPDDPDCEPIFTRLGLNFSNGMPDPSRQSFFRVE